MQTIRISTMVPNLFMASVIAVGFANWCVAQVTPNAGEFDVTFGNQGITFTDQSPDTNDIGTDIGFQSDGKIVVVGSTGEPNGGNSTPSDFLIQRFDTDGVLDTTFGNGGSVVLDFLDRRDVVSRVSIGGDDSIVVYGISNQTAMLTYRLAADGSLDASFGDNGRVFISNTSFGLGGNNGIFPGGVEVLAGGKILVGGTSQGKILMVRYNTDGTLDSSFDGDGKLKFDMAPINGAASGGSNNLDIDSTGKIVFASHYRFGGLADFVFAKFHSNGLIDTSFGNNGVVIRDVANADKGLNDMVLDDSDRIVGVGFGGITRLNSDGSVDTSFGTNGETLFATVFSPNFTANRVSIMANGRIVVSGFLFGSNTMYVLRFEDNGALDVGFGIVNGRTLIEAVGNPKNAGAAKIDGQGRILAVGGRRTGTNTTDLLLARLLGDNLPPNADAGSDIVVECTGELTPVMLNGTASSDPDGDDIEFEWAVPAESGTTLDDPNSAMPIGMFPLGPTLVTLTVTDGNGGMDVTDVLVTVEDTTPPVLVCTTDKIALWPPNHQMENVLICVAVSDSCSNPAGLVVNCNISSNEEDDAKGDGNSTGDVDGLDGFTAPVPVTLVYDGTDECFYGIVSLRAERDGAEEGRVYSIVCNVEDDSGNEATASCVVIVPHNKRR